MGTLFRRKSEFVFNIESQKIFEAHAVRRESKNVFTAASFFARQNKGQISAIDQNILAPLATCVQSAMMLCEERVLRKKY